MIELPIYDSNGQEVDTVITTELLFQGQVVHRLKGEHGRRQLEFQAGAWNKSGYEPVLPVNKKARCEMNESERRKADYAAPHYGYSKGQ